LGTPANEILTKLTFSHIVELQEREDPALRAFYELGVHPLTPPSTPFEAALRQAGFRVLHVTHSL